jgi:serine/tyrosine/threonine adenylyltransferase
VLRYRNQRAAESVGLGELTALEWESHFAGFDPLLCNLHEPLALRYHGHQFGVYNAQLGDGRGFLYAQMREVAGAKRLLDLGTKGSGQTPWSRGGDGRLTLKGGVREVLATEMLEAHGVSTSKSFSLFETGEALMRGDEPSPTRSSVLVRLGHSHVRFGTFQRFAHLGDDKRLARLLDYAIEHYMPELAAVADGPGAFLREVARRSADLCASFMIAGFVHGVLNTDNMNITGEAFDYGPFRFLPRYEEGFTAAYFDHTGLYAYAQQPRAFLWNVLRLAESLKRIAPSSAFGDVASAFEQAYNTALERRFLARLGLLSRGADEDARLVVLAFAFLEESPVGFDRFFFDWFGGATSDARAQSGERGKLYDGERFVAFREAMGEHAPSLPSVLATPYFQADAPCTLLIDEVERVWSAIAERDDWAPFEAKIAQIRAMPRTAPPKVAIL